MSGNAHFQTVAQKASAGGLVIVNFDNFIYLQESAGLAGLVD